MNMYTRIDNVLRLFRVEPHAPVPFALEDAVKALFDENHEYFSFDYKGHTVVTRMACIETYLVDVARLELFGLAKRLFVDKTVLDAEEQQLLSEVELFSDREPYLPNLGTILRNMQRELDQFYEKLQEQYGSIQFGERFKLCDLRVAEARENVFRYEGPFEYGAEWSLLNSWTHRYYVVSGDDWSLVTCQKW